MASANDLKDLYELALTRDASLQAAGFPRDAAIEVRPQALAQWLPQVSACASADTRARGLRQRPVHECGGRRLRPSAPPPGTQHCYGTARASRDQHVADPVELPGLQPAEGGELSGRRRRSQPFAARSRTCCCAWRRPTSRSCRPPISWRRIAPSATPSGPCSTRRRTREQTGVGPRSDVEQAQAFYDATEQSVIDAQNALDDANLALTEIVGPHTAAIAPLREDIPLVSPEPASADEWVTSARQDNFDVRSAELKMEAAERDIGAQRGRGLPTFSLTGSSSKLTQDRGAGRQSNPGHGRRLLQLAAVSRRRRGLGGAPVARAVPRRRRPPTTRRSAMPSGRRGRRFAASSRGIQRIGAARRAVDSGRGAVEASRRNVEFGTGTEFDLLNAQNNYYAARARLQPVAL